MSRVIVTGATGTIGRAVCRRLEARGDEVVALSRDRERAAKALGDQVEVQVWADPTGEMPPVEALTGADAIVHLVGEPVAQSWSKEAKARIRDSRVSATRMLVAALREVPELRRPAVLISQSATGFYGPSGDRELDEDAPAGNDFLAGVVREWEAEAANAEGLARTVMTRTGVVLSSSGGALEKMLPFFRMGVGGPVAGGRQYVPWIHLDDVVAGLLFCVERPELAGPINLTAPVPVTNAQLSHALGRVLHRPAVLPVPTLALRVPYGEMSQIVTTGQRAIPTRLSEAGFEFRHPDLEAALRDVLTTSG
ncbi:MAG TPA: TIGR01777 family oxidoreductase [Solirubrobacteraceae bacterium]|nr:TIGR01777 family oxidoreductase [Solirubrobacteraceae bacterium]